MYILRTYATQTFINCDNAHGALFNYYKTYLIDLGLTERT